MYRDIEAAIYHLENSHEWKHAAVRFRQLRQICRPPRKMAGGRPVALAVLAVTGLTSRKVFILAPIRALRTDKVHAANRYARRNSRSPVLPHDNSSGLGERNAREQTAPSMDCSTIEHDLADVSLFAPAFAELAAPRAVRHQAEWPAAMIAEVPSPPRSWDRLIRDLDDRHDALARCSGADAVSRE
jgi:hypothetical protein